MASANLEVSVPLPLFQAEIPNVLSVRASF
jgi:hypothetical protein